MSGWKEVKIGDIVDLVQGLAINAKTNYLLVEKNGLPLLRIKDLLENKSSMFINPELAPKGCLVSEKDLIMTRTGQVGYVFMGKKGVLHNNSFKIIPKSNEISSKFLYCYFNTAISRENLTSIAAGSVQPDLTHKIFKEYSLLLPPLPEQERIAEVLSSLDDKIDLLHRNNKTLEQLAETLFRQWFVQEAEEDWDEVSIEEFSILNPETVTKNFNQSHIEYLDTGSIVKGHVQEYQSFKITEAPSRAQRLVKNNDIVYSLVRPNQCHYGILSNSKPNTVVSTGFCVIRAKTISPYFLYLLLTNETNVEQMHSIAEGSTSTYPSLRPDDIGKFKFLLPPKEKIEYFHNIAQSSWNKIHSNYSQIKQLETLRDTLLPKLMSGVVRVEN